MSELKIKIESEKKLAKQIFDYLEKIEKSPGNKSLERNIVSLQNQIKGINDTLPGLLKVKKERVLPRQPDAIIKTEQRVETKPSNPEAMLSMNKKDRESISNELNLDRAMFARIGERRKEEKEDNFVMKKPGFFARLANQLFFNFSTRMIEKGSFKDLNLYLRKGNMPYLLQTYVSIIFLSTLVSIIAGLLIFIVLAFFDTGIIGGGIGSRILSTFWIVIVLPIATFLFATYNPKFEASSIGKKIDNELPFLTLHLSAISGSGIEPSKIFMISANSREYPNTRVELRKLINQMNIYGMDLVASLKESARRSPSKKLAELFNGIATTITSGGELKDFFTKRSETLLFEYKLDREKYTQLAETFMNIYISVVIAAPLVLMLLLIMVSVMGVSIGLSLSQFSIVIVLAVALINALFLGFLKLKQGGF